MKDRCADSEGFVVRDRPDVAVGYGLGEAGEYDMTAWERVVERVAESQNYWVASVRVDGRPHCMPVWGAWVEETLYFGTDKGSVKAHNFAANPAASVHLESGDDVVVLEGAVQVVEDMGVMRKINDVFVAKYGLDVMDMGDSGMFYGLVVRKAFAWREDDFVNTATRWRFGG